MTPDPIYYTSNTWNLARGIASSAIDVSESTVDTGEDGPIQIGELYLSVKLVSNLPSEDIQPEVINSVESDKYTEASESNEVWPFDDLHHLLELVDENLGIRSENRDLNDLAKEISSMVQEDPQYEYLSEPQDGTEEEQVEEDEAEEDEAEEDEAEEEQVEEDGKNSENIDRNRIRGDREKNGQEKNNKSSETTDSVDSQQTNTDTISAAEINKNSGSPNSESDSVEGEADENIEQATQQDEGSTQTINNNDNVRKISESLYDCFKQRQGDITYTDIAKEYQSPFPDRSVTLQFVMNVSSDRHKGVDQIQEWVSEWFENPEAVKSENENFSRRPMGSVVRSD